MTERSDRYIPPAWRSRGTSNGNGPTRTYRDQADDREQSIHAGRGRGRGRGAMRAPNADGPSRWHEPVPSSGDIWSSMPASGGQSSSTRAAPELRPAYSSSSIHRSTPITSNTGYGRSTANDVPGQGASSSTVQPRANPASFRAPTQQAPTTPSRLPQSTQTTSLSSPSADLQPISSSHRAFKKLDEMEMLGTLSRSGGNGDGEGDGLLDRDVQERFLGWIEDKLESFYGRFPSFRSKDPLDRILYTQSEADEAIEKDGRESLGVILLHLRKLREGVLASRRMDSFAVKVYEMSSLLSIRAGNHPQLISSLSVLVPGIYLKSSISPNADLITKVEALALESKKPDRRAYFASLLLMYHIAHRDSAIDFWTDYFKLTRPTGRKSSRIPAFARSDDPDIRLALSVYRAITQPSPLSYYRILRSDLTADQKMVIGFALPKIRERIWGMMRSGWSMGMKVDFAGSLLGYETIPQLQSTDNEDEWDDHLKNGSTNAPRPDKLLQSLGGRTENGKVLFK